MKIALWQTHPQTQTERALEALSEAAKMVAGQGADMLVTPEMYLGGYNIGAEQIATHARQSGQVLDGIQSIAREHGIAIVAGLALPGHPRPYNACVAIDGAGQEIARCHKTHLFGEVDRAQFTAGQSIPPVFDLNGWKAALAICYDVEFPELVRAHALHGADLIVCPTANMVPFDSVAARLVPARAEENAVYLAYCNYTGSEDAFTYNGLSCVCGPDGEDIVRGAGAETMLWAELDQSVLKHARQRQTHLADRRPDIYGDLT
ncbi:carbon-nitrogen hydrolase family protein [uncultured Roseobacter sp.]|uniref:carbon-nitrogen hydrolase family protein n=1 Tax=uncultured Roseobacter sp. TaxID=114847 RepID=UPI00260F4ADB|nr:carbon-nitrogen hydrolase family protein [uncultured Roseobacter sp.]